MCPGPLWICCTSTTWSEGTTVEAAEQHGSRWYMFWGQIWCLYNGVRWAFIQEAWTCQQTWIYSMEIERAGKASDMLKENHSLEDNLRSHKTCKFYACCPRKTWQGTIAKQIHTSVQVWISKLDTAWKRFQHTKWPQCSKRCSHIL